MQAQITTATFGDDRLPPHFWTKVRLGSVPPHRPDLGPCWEWTAGCTGKGYSRFVAGSKIDASNRLVYAHRLAYEILTGAIPQGLQADHLCRNRACIRPTHIELVTNAVNSQRGESAKLTAVVIPIIRSLLGKELQVNLARRFGVSRQAISDIQHGRTWSNAS